MAVTPKISDLSEINELMQLIKDYETKIEGQEEKIKSLRDDYNLRLSQEKAAMTNSLINQKKLAAFSKSITALVQEERELLDSVSDLQQTIEDFISKGGLKDYIEKILKSEKDAELIVGDDVASLAPKHSKTNKGPEGQLRVKIGSKLYIFDPEMLRSELTNRYVSQIVTN